MKQMLIRIATVFCWALCISPASAESLYHFSVLNQRSPTLTAQYWNPILAYVSRKAGVELKLVMGRTAPETTALTVRGDAQFAYTNHLFTTERVKLGWKVIARPDTNGIRGELVTAEGSTIHRLEDLQDQTVAFPSAEAFVGYRVPMDVLLRKGIKVTPSFGGTQEGAMGQLRAGRTVAAGVNEDVMEVYGRREKFRYRVLWTSETFFDLPIMVAPVVPKEVVKAVQSAFVEMQRDPEGRRILEECATLLKLPGVVGFVMAGDHDYENYRAFFRNAQQKE